MPATSRIQPTPEAPQATILGQNGKVFRAKSPYNPLINIILTLKYDFPLQQITGNPRPGHRKACLPLPPRGFGQSPENP